jgi:hypothetical protein
VTYRRRSDYIRPAALRLIPALRNLAANRLRPDYEQLAEWYQTTPAVVRQHVHHLRRLNYIARYP